MAKGFFTQCAVVLLESAPTAAALAKCLSKFRVVAETPAPENPWFGGRGVTLAMRPEVNGYVFVTPTDGSWPDAMGSPDSVGSPHSDANLFAAWSMGWFGPFTYPECLSRAVAMSFGWEGAEEATARHRAFVRVSCSYVLGAKPDAPVLPTEYSPLDELCFVTDVVRALMALPGALAYFNPNGEVLRSGQGLEEELATYRELDLVALPVWTNVRLFQITPTWTLMDTVGMAQLDVDDHEACFQTDKYSPGDVDNFLRNATDYVRNNGPVIEDGDTMDGPGDVPWSASTAESLAPAPRTVLRWTPVDGTVPPDEISSTKG